MNAKSKIGDLIRAMARKDWGMIDQLQDDLRELEWAGATQMVGAAFALAVNERFGHTGDLRVISDFVRETRSRYADGKELPALEMEGLIRAALGEAELLDSISADVSLPAQIVILGTLLEDANFTEAQLEEFLREVESAADEYM